MLEKTVENAVTRWAHRNGIGHRKMNGLGNRDWPDQFFYSKRFKKGIKGVWIEFKAPGKVPTGMQFDKMNELSACGFDVEWFDVSKEAIAWLKGFLQ